MSISQISIYGLGVLNSSVSAVFTRLKVPRLTIIRVGRLTSNNI